MGKKKKAYVVEHETSKQPEEPKETKKQIRTELHCRVCLVPKAETELDSTRRCSFCANVKAATDAGLTYGQYKGRQYAAVLEIRAKQAALDRQIQEQARHRHCEHCIRCGAEVPANSAYENFCCRECYLAYSDRQRDAQERGAIRQPEPPKEPEPLRTCPRCGKVLTGRKKYCSEQCKYLFNQKKYQERAKLRCQENAAPRPPRFCRQCGKQISDAKRNAYCSPECAHAAHNEQKRLRRAEKQ